eukprot:CAMPEP_0181311882 /NCGR_PEP_ID=MMETSP1101-20121128/13390_1 /TAXON_ID=46948 /ORGANISM="Rhodomonas abbreviata, Strain Caron Lab Isolate" /LENGTH=191 /DNA_ID=CAMNT_0023418675 /DNA_START=48 /DNA_END=623 /DNA_ORIENTATION=+
MPVDWVLERITNVFPKFDCNSNTGQTHTEETLGRAQFYNDLHEVQAEKINAYYNNAGAPLSPLLSAASTSSPQSTPPGSPHLSVASKKTLLGNRNSLRGMVRKCLECDSIGDSCATTCEICGETFPNRASIERILEPQPEPFNKEKIGPILWSQRELRIRSPSGGSRKILIPHPDKLGNDFVPHCSEGKWM